MTAEANKELVRRLFADVFVGGDLDALDPLVRADYIQHNEAVAGGRAGLRAFVEEVRRAFPDLEVTIEDLVAEGDRVVARISTRGTHRGPFLGRPATGRVVVGRAIDIFRVQDGQLAEHWDVMDVHGLLAQMAG
ncbi:MAG: ester cyclase [Planctomycetes bacterium]|nr:ester cyclase [Planctomycetota bacterium]